MKKIILEELVLISTIKPVCKDCEKRNPGCHSVCQDYIFYREKLDEYNEKVRKEKLAAGQFANWSKSKRKKLCRR